MSASPTTLPDFRSGLQGSPSYVVVDSAMSHEFFQPLIPCHIFENTSFVTSIVQLDQGVRIIYEMRKKTR
jgi:hypothetical protein